MFWFYSTEHQKYLQMNGINHWRPLIECYNLNNKRMPFKVQKKQGGKIEEILFIANAETPWGLEWITFNTGINVYSPTQAAIPQYRLIPYYFKNECSCDWRQILLITGCRCGKN